MKHQVTLQMAMVVIRWGAGALNGCPTPAGSSRLFILQHNVRVWITIFNMVISLSSSLHTMYVYREDVIRVVKVASETTAVLSAFTYLIICKVHARRIQDLIHRLETFLKEATQKEKKVVQDYVNKCFMVYAITLVSSVFGPLAFIAGPLLTSQPFPGDIVYPFSIESTWVWAAMYFSQSICIIQIGSMVYTDIMFAMLLWFAGARFHMLCLALQEATNADEVNRCIEQHQDVIGYVEELMITVRCIAVEVTVVGLFKITTGGYILISNLPLYEFAKYTIFVSVSALELYLLAWPADHLIEVSESVGRAAYDCPWIGKAPRMVKNVLFVIQRCRNPAIIAVNGVLPVLSLEFYGSTMAAAFSYITTLRALTAE